MGEWTIFVVVMNVKICTETVSRICARKKEGLL